MRNGLILALGLLSVPAFAGVPVGGAPTVKLTVRMGVRKCATPANGAPTCFTSFSDPGEVSLALTCIEDSITPYVECNSPTWTGTITADDQTFSPSVQVFLLGAGGSTPATDSGNYSFGAGVFGSNVNYSIGKTFDFAPLMMKGAQSMSVTRDNGEVDTYLPLFLLSSAGTSAKL